MSDTPAGFRRCYGAGFAGRCEEDWGHGIGVVPISEFTPGNKRSRHCTRRYQRARRKVKNEGRRAS